MLLAMLEIHDPDRSIIVGCASQTASLTALAPFPSVKAVSWTYSPASQTIW